MVGENPRRTRRNKRLNQTHSDKGEVFGGGGRGQKARGGENQGKKSDRSLAPRIGVSPIARSGGGFFLSFSGIKSQFSFESRNTSM